MANIGIIPQPIVHTFNEINIGKYKGTKHYEIVEVTNGKNQLSETINICNDRGFAKSSPAYWLKIRVANKWKILTGLFATDNDYYFVADKGRNNVKEALLFVKFNQNKQVVTVYYFKNFYTNNIYQVLQTLIQ